MGQMRKARDIMRLAKTIASFSDNQACLVDRADQDEDSLDTVMVRIKPNSGLYLGGTFDFEINLESYPENSPSVKCITKIYHPNIDCMEEEDNVCLNILDSGWSHELTLEDLVQGFLFLLYNPNLEDPLSPLFDSETSYQEYADNVVKSLKGAKIEDFKFDFNFLSDSENVDPAKGENCDTEPAIGVTKTKEELVIEAEVQNVFKEEGVNSGVDVNKEDNVNKNEACSLEICSALERQWKADAKLLAEVAREGVSGNGPMCVSSGPMFTDSLMPEINMVSKMLPKFFNQFLCCLRTKKPK